jgi:Amt family ammonium transporter
MNTKLASSTSMVTAPCKFFLLLATLLFSYAFTVHADDLAEEAAVEEAAEEAPPNADDSAPYEGDYEVFAASEGFPLFTVNNLWILIAAFLVFTMHLGFATLESGLCRSKNTVNILFKNVFIISIGILTYAFYGFNAMYPGDMIVDGVGDWNGYFAVGSWFGVDPTDTTQITDAYNVGYTWWTDFLFQAMFAATGATIVSGAVAERIKLPAFMLFAVLFVGIAYPTAGSWKWGTGWLDAKGFYDFAGSSIVHAFGGFGALACVIILGPRKGKYTEGGLKPIPASNFPLAAIGVFLLFLGWFGFNGGSVLSADPALVSYVCVTTALAAASGAVSSIVFSYSACKKPDLSMALNGILAGLVGITAGADVVGIFDSIIIGLIAGAIVVFSILFFDKQKIDDPVGAISVHGICGIWGTLAVGIFGDSGDPENPFTVGTQLLGTFSYSLFAFVFAYVVFSIIKGMMGVRVSEEEEERGLDISEHGQEAYTN